VHAAAGTPILDGSGFAATASGAKQAGVPGRFPRVMRPPHDGLIRRVLLAVDLTSRSELVLQAARRVVPDPSVEFQLMHVVRDLAEVLGVYDSGQSTDALQREIETRAQDRLRGLREDLLGDRPHVEIALRKGPIWGEIVAAAMAFQADLAFMGAHFSDAARERRSVADLAAKIAKITPCPIVVVPSEES
jgi:nucleotide-binding universal stress UspA family protein